jgi:Predicted glycosyltransferases
MSDGRIPVVLFAFNRPAHLARVLECLRGEHVPLVVVFADGARGRSDVESVAAVRRALRAIDWCEVRLVERETNLGLGRNVLAGVSEVAAAHEAFVVWEDDLVCVPGTYAWMSAALRRYARDERVMSVSAWTHPRVTPAEVGERPYFDRRAECWGWGAWARSWRGMTQETAWKKMKAAEAAGVAAGAYGEDLPRMAREELRRNIWAVRWLYHHFQHGGLCVRPPWSMVEHIGFDAQATQAGDAIEWANPPLRSAPPIPAVWPEPGEHAACRGLWAAANPPGGWRGLAQRVWRKVRRTL